MGWEILTYACLTVIVVLTIYGIESGIKRVERKVDRAELYLELILERLEIDVPSRLPEKIKSIALDPHRRIEAIKLYREETGAGLREAKDAIEDFIERNRHLHS